MKKRKINNNCNKKVRIHKFIKMYNKNKKMMIDLMVKKKKKKEKKVNYKDKKRKD